MINEYNFDAMKKPIVNFETVIKKLEDYVDWPEGNFQELKSYIEDLQTKYGNCLSWQLKTEIMGYNYDDVYVKVVFERYETEEEKEDRIYREKRDLKDWETILNKRNQKANKKHKEEKEKRKLQYEALKKEFEK